MQERPARKALTGLRLAVLLVCAFAIAVPVLPVFSTQASAQLLGERGEIRSFFRSLFGRREKRPERAPPAEVQRPAEPRSQASRKVEPEPPVVEKLKNARKVLVIGDFVAGSLADGLKEAFEESPGVLIVDRSNGSSGLVRDDYYDWNSELPAIIDAVDPMAAVIQIGSNDRQQIKTADGRFDALSPEWMSEYDRRLARFLALLKERSIPIFWAGAIPFQKTDLTSDMLALNSLYRSATEAVDGEFVDVWDGFVDENGGFVYTGADINGQPVRLRRSDGINLTDAGKRKIAFYVEKPLRRLLGDAARPDLGTLGSDSLPELVFFTPNIAVNVRRTPPIRLSDPALDGADMLLGGKETLPAKGLSLRTPRDRLVEDGVLDEPPAGRADSYTALLPDS